MWRWQRGWVYIRCIARWVARPSLPGIALRVPFRVQAISLVIRASLYTAAAYHLLRLHMLQNRSPSFSVTLLATATSIPLRTLSATRQVTANWLIATHYSSASCLQLKQFHSGIAEH